MDSSQKDGKGKSLFAQLKTDLKHASTNTQATKNVKAAQDPRPLFYAYVDFGSETTSPIPSSPPSRHNSHAVLPAIPGTAMTMFPGERCEIAEFGAFINDEHGAPIGIHLDVKSYPDRFQEFFDLPESPVQSLELLLDKKEFFDDSTYENGVRTYVYRSFILRDRAED